MKKITNIILFMLIILMGSSCSKISSNNMEDIYLRCNATSQGNMAEIESGFYYLSNSHLYYADRSDISNWVSVCNEPDCKHEIFSSCNANIGYEMTQKEDELYYYKEFSIWKVGKDGSQSKNVFDLPIEGAGMIANASRGIISQEMFVFYYSILEENGLLSESIFRLEEDGSLYPLFVKESDSPLYSSFFLPSYLNHVRGDFTIMADILVEDDENVQNIVFRVDGDEPERVNLPEDVSVLWSYLAEDTLTYYRENEGFFQINLESYEETCITENQLTDARGYVLTEDYLIECNRYKENTPEEAFMKFFDGSKWIDVSLPEVVTKTDYSFSPISVASDRIFFKLSIWNPNENSQLYYFMLGEDNPELKLASTIGDENLFDVTNVSDSETILSQFKEMDITLLDTEECFAKLLGIGYDPKNSNNYLVKIYCENKTDKMLELWNDYISINGVTAMFGKAMTLEENQTKEETYSIPKENFLAYGIDCEQEFTNILLSYFIMVEGEYRPNVITAIYPYGEDKAITTKREPLPTDKIIIDNEFVKVTIVESWSNSEISTENEENNNVIDDGISAPVLCVVENKTKDRIIGGVGEFLSINGKDWNFGGNNTTILPESYVYAQIRVLDDWLEKLQIEGAIEEYIVKFVYRKVGDTKDWGNLDNLEILFESDEIVLKPEE